MSNTILVEQQPVRFQVGSDVEVISRSICVLVYARRFTCRVFDKVSFRMRVEIITNLCKL